MVVQGQITAPSLIKSIEKIHHSGILGQHNQHPVNLVDPVLEENVGGLVGLIFQVLEGVFLLFTLLGNPRSLPACSGLFMPIHRSRRNQNYNVQGLVWKTVHILPDNWIGCSLNLP